MGTSCGKAKFDWYTITKERMSVRRGEKACVFVLSNATAQELLSAAVRGAETLTQVFGRQIAEDLVVRYTDDAYEAAVKSRLKAAGWKWLAQGMPRALAAFRAVNAITLVGKTVAVTAVPLGKLTVLNEIKNKNACVQITADLDGRRLKLDWNLIYNPSALKNPRRDVDLTLASVRDREERFGSDKLRKRPVGLRCGRRGNVERHSTPNAVFRNAVTVVR
jgi:hypothetical protein